jgi:hypothetical protein
LALAFSALGLLIVAKEHDGGASITGGILGILLGAAFLIAACSHWKCGGQIQGGFRVEEVPAAEIVSSATHNISQTGSNLKWLLPQRSRTHRLMPPSGAASYSLFLILQLRCVLWLNKYDPTALLRTQPGNSGRTGAANNRLTPAGGHTGAGKERSALYPGHTHRHDLFGQDDPEQARPAWRYRRNTFSIASANSPARLIQILWSLRKATISLKTSILSMASLYQN